MTHEKQSSHGEGRGQKKMEGGLARRRVGALCVARGGGEEGTCEGQGSWRPRGEEREQGSEDRGWKGRDERMASKGVVGTRWHGIAVGPEKAGRIRGSSAAWWPSMEKERWAVGGRAKRRREGGGRESEKEEEGREREREGGGERKRRRRRRRRRRREKGKREKEKKEEEREKEEEERERRRREGREIKKMREKEIEKEEEKEEREKEEGERKRREEGEREGGERKKRRSVITVNF